MKLLKPVYFTIIFFTLFSCGKKKEEEKPPAFPISKQQAVVKDADIFIETIGHVESITSVDIRSRVEGELMQVFFEEGDEINKDAPLFTIDTRPYKIALENAEAELKQNLANLHLAEDKLRRNTPLLKEEYISQIDFDQLLTNVETYRALVDQNKASINNANLNLEYCHISSPLNGKTGILNIDRGNLIAPNSSTPLITINQLVPIYVTFSIPENELFRTQNYEKEKTLTVRVTLNEFKNHSLNGKLELINNEVDVDTGMIKLRGIFTNNNKELWPGKFVRTRLILTIQKNAVIIPFQAVQITSYGPIAFVVKEDNTVEKRDLTLGQREDENIIIEKGINPNEYVVTKGQINLIDKAHVFVPKEFEGEKK